MERLAKLCLLTGPVPEQQTTVCALTSHLEIARGWILDHRRNRTKRRTNYHADPILAIPLEVRDIDSDWANCVGSIDGVYDPPIALTPVDAIALPTVSGNDPKHTEFAAPAPTPTPTDAPNTSPPEPEKPSKTALHEEDPDRTSKTEIKPSPSEPDKPSKTALSKGESDRTSESEVEPSSLGPDPEDSPLPTHEDQPEEIKRPAEPTNQATKPLSILFSALFPATTTETGAPENDGSPEFPAVDSHTTDYISKSDSADEKKPTPNPQALSDSSESDLITGAGPSPQDKPIATVVPLQGGGSATIQKAGSSLIIAQDGLSSAATRGGVIIIGTHIYSAASDGSGVVVDEVATHTIPSFAAPIEHNESPAAVWTQAGETFSAVMDGSSVVVQGSGAATTLPAGAVATLAGQEFSVPTSGGMLVHDGSTVALAQNTAASHEDPATTIVHDGETIVASATGNKVVFQQGGSAVTLSAGQRTVIDGHTLSVAPLGDGLVIDGGEAHSTLLAPTTTDSSYNAITTFVHDGETFTASATGSNAVFQHGGSDFTISAGDKTVIDGRTFSVMPSGGAVVVAEGNETISLFAESTSGDATGGSGTTRNASPTTSEADASETSPSGTQSGTEPVDDEIEANSAALRLSGSLSVAVGISSFVVVMALA